MEIYANTCKSFLEELTVLNNKILRILHHSYRAHAAELYKNYNNLDIPGVHIYQLCLVVHKFLFCNNMLPFVFDIILHETVQFISITQQGYDLYLQRCHSSLGKRLIKFKARQLWNQLPNEIKENQHPLSFKQQLKKYMLSKLT